MIRTSRGSPDERRSCDIDGAANDEGLHDRKLIASVRLKRELGERDLWSYLAGAST